MATTRCPGCGAKNDQGAVKCRLCSFDLRGHSEMPATRPPVGVDVMKSGSLKSVFALAVLGVVAIVLAGVLLGILPGGDVLTTLRNKVPALATESSDGWSEFSQDDARFAATMPVDRVQRQLPAAWTTSGSIDQWVSTLGSDENPDTTLAIGWTTVPAPEGENVEATTTSQLYAYADALGGRVDKIEETSFQGFPAVLAKIEGLKSPTGDPVTIRTLFVRRREQLFVLASQSVYGDHPQFDRLVNGFTLL
jgi:hypothetical protein